MEGRMSAEHTSVELLYGQLIKRFTFLYMYNEKLEQ